MSTPASRSARRMHRPKASSTSAATADDPAEQPARRAAAVARLAPLLSESSRPAASLRLYDEIERPLVRVLARMELAGVARRRRVPALPGRRAHRGGPPRSRRRSRSSPATRSRSTRPAAAHRAVRRARPGAAEEDEDRLLHRRRSPSRSWPGQHPIIEQLLRYREVEKLRSTYGEALLGEVAADGRIHATFNQTVARTGRLSSRPAEPAQHPGPHGGGPPVPPGVRPRRRAASCSSPTTTRSSCGSSPTWPRTRA